MLDMLRPLHRLCLLGALAASLVSARPAPGTAAPGFTLPGLFGNQAPVSLKSLQGQVVLIDFWASWCPPCRTTIPALSRLRARHPGLVILALSIDEDYGKAFKFLKARDTAVVFLHDAKREAAERYDLGGMPSAFLVDKQGVLRERFDGYGESDLKAMEAKAVKLLGEAK